MRFSFIYLSVLLLIACSQEGSRQQSVAKLASCPGFAQTGKPTLVHRAECGTIDVPLDHQLPTGEQLSVYVLRLPAIHPAPKTDPLFVIAGGPGQSASKLAEQIYYTFEDVRKERDLVFIDQRGTGKSQAFHCQKLSKLVLRGSTQEQRAALHQGLRECLAIEGESAPFLTTHYAVEDLEYIRKALGYPQVNLWGGSYGTRVALAYQQRYPASVRTSVLDGVAPVSIALPWSAEADALAALQALQRDCAAHSECARRYGDLQTQAEGIAARLAVKPASLEIEHPLTRLAYTAEINTAFFASALRMALYSRDLARILPLAIQQAADEDYRLIAALTALAESRDTFADISIGMHYTVLCSEDYPQFQGRDTAESEVFLNLQLVNQLSEICAFWPQASILEDDSMPAVSDVPTLMLSGARDPVTPPRWAESLLPQLSRARHFVAPGGHHIVTQDGCTAQLIARFIQLGDVAELDGGCIARIKPLPAYFGVEEEALAALEKNNSEGDSANDSH